jgi:SAM-dependent methyltransferase
MERLDFGLPDFTRFSWTSDRAREVWGPRLHRITKAWLEIEWRSVVAGVRPCGVTMVGPEEFVEQAGDWVRHGLSAVPVEIQGLNGGAYASTSRQALLGEPFVFRVVVGSPRDVADFKAAWDAGDNPEIGRRLGYPPCCYAFFQQTWVEGGYVDTTWPMAHATAAPANGARTVDVTAAPEANILWRWMGIRAVPHLPCRFDCEPTASLGRALVQVGRDVGYGDEMDWLLEILAWPVEWSALHGIAEIKTPILKVSTRTDATAVKYVVRRLGIAYPAEGAQGLTFPYRMLRPHPLLTTSRGFQRGLANAIPTVATLPDWYATDNGFSSRTGMDRAHEPVVDLARATVRGRGGNVLDLGCGNGALLRKILQANPRIVPFGIDVERSRVAHAQELLPDFRANFVVGDLFESEELWADGRRYALALLMPGRFLEADAERAKWLREKLEAQCDQLLIYAYGDWLTRFGDLRGLAREAGLKLVSPGPVSVAGLAGCRQMQVAILSPLSAGGQE